MNASELDRAYGLAPHNKDLAAERARVLDSLAREEYGLRFRYIPAGEFLMGSEQGDADERPVHPVHVEGFWMSETTVSWFDFARLIDWQLPPVGAPKNKEADGSLFFLAQANKIRLQYCEDKTLHAVDWHAHAGAKIFAAPKREDDSPLTYSEKPMVAVSWQDAEELCEKLSGPNVRFRLPTEAEWEKAARGGLVEQRFSWGNELPTAARCDFNRFDEFWIKPSRSHPPNGYGLYALCGSVWEWTSDYYDALAYSGASIPLTDTADRARVLRGGSWCDTAEAVTVSFRMARKSASWRSEGWGQHFAPNIGFRLCMNANPR